MTEKYKESVTKYGRKRMTFMDAFGWINLALLIILLVGYAYHKGTYNSLKVLWDDLKKSHKASNNLR